MSKQNQSSTTSRKEAEHLAELKKSLEPKALAIICRFVDPFKPLSTNGFKNLAFRTLHDAYVNRNNSIVGDHEISDLVFLWDIMEDIAEIEEDLKAVIPLLEDWLPELR